MSEIERLRADLEVLERYYDKNYCGPNETALACGSRKPGKPVE